MVHFQGSASKSFVYFSGCQRPENRLKKLQDICKWGPVKSADSPNRMGDSWNQMPVKLKPEHGWHRDCYRSFTKNLNCLKFSTEDSETIQQFRTSGRSSTALEKMVFKPDCILCNKEGQKKIKEKGIWTTKAIAVFECQGWKTVLETAENKRDKFLRMIWGFDLSSCETRFHSSSRRQCQRNPTHLNLSKHYL